MNESITKQITNYKRQKKIIKQTTTYDNSENKAYNERTTKQTQTLFENIKTNIKDPLNAQKSKQHVNKTNTAQQHTSNIISKNSFQTTASTHS